MNRQGVDTALTAIASELAALGHGPVEADTLKRLLILSDQVHQLRIGLARMPHYFNDTPSLRRHY